LDRSKATNKFCGLCQIVILYSYEFILPVKFSNMSRRAYGWKKFCKLALLLVSYIERYHTNKTNLSVY